MVGPQGLKDFKFGTAQVWRMLLTTVLAALGVTAHACCLAAAASPLGATSAAILSVALVDSWRVLDAGMHRVSPHILPFVLGH